LNALEHAKRGQEYAEHLGDIYTQARCLCQQAFCLLILGNYRQAQLFLQNARDFVESCGLQEGLLDAHAINHEAEIHLLKTEYLESRHIQVSITFHVQPTTVAAIVANLNIAFIDTITGIDSKLIHKHLDSSCLFIKKLHRLDQTLLGNLTNQILADLTHRDGDHTTAHVLLSQTFASVQETDVQVTLECLSRLADLSTELSNIRTTMHWAGIFLSLALMSKDRLAIMKAFRCLGQISVAQGDIETALSLFTVALDGFTFMDVHR
jgi:hypothetical protein